MSDKLEKISMEVPSKEETTIKSKAKPKQVPWNKKPAFSVEEIQEKLCSLFNALAFFLKVDKRYTPGDFKEESNDVVRLSAKYTWLSRFLTVLDPLFLVLNLTKKLMDMGKIVRDRRIQEREQEVGSDSIWQQ